MHRSLCHYVPYVLSGLLVIAGCERVERSMPSPENGAMDAGDTPSPAAGMGGTSGTGGSAGFHEMGGSGAFTGLPPYLADGGSRDCPSPPHAAGIASGVLGETPPRLTETFAFPGNVEPDRNPWLLRSRDGGLLALAVGFADVDFGGTGEWHAVGARAIADVTSADFDGDGDEDLIALDERIDDGTPYDVLSAWERTSDGLVARGDLPATNQPYNRYALGDVDGDGDLDVTTFERGVVVVMRNDGDFVFSRVESSPPVEDYAYLGTAHAAVLDDRDADGIADLRVLAARGEAQVLTLLGDGTGRFAAPIGEPVTGHILNDEYLHDAKAGDVTGDGLTDFVLRDTHIGIVLVDGAHATTVGANGGHQLQLLDFDGDGVLDIAALSGDIEVHLSRGGGTFETRALNVGSWDMDDFEISLATEDRPTELHALYRMYCYEPCNASCARCMFGACVECMTHADCTTGLCERHECTTGEPAGAPQQDDDGGVP